MVKGSFWSNTGPTATQSADIEGQVATATAQAQIATTQAGVATTKASQSASSATASETAKTGAETAKAGAESARDTALTYRDQTLVYKDNALSHKNSAETAQTASETARDTASGHASTAETHKNTATTQAGISTAQAVISTTQAGIATTKATEASNSATTATSAKNDAETAKTDAETAQTASETARDTASDHRADAGKYAITAEDSTFTLTSTNGGTSGLYSALHYQAKAQANQTASETAQTASESARDLSQSYRDTAETHKNTANTHATTATTQAGIATTQAGIATTQAGIATTQASNASTSASSAQTALTTFLASPTFTGTPSAPTATSGTNTTQIATTAFVSTAVADLVNSAPASLDTLDELANALGDDASFATTVTNNIATKLNSSAVSSFGLTLIDDATADDALTTLGIDGAKVKSLYEAETNAFTDAQFTKLAGIETSATADQTGAEIKTLYEAESDTNALTDALLTKLNNIEANATADQTASEIKTAYESNSNTNAFTDTQVSQLASLQAGLPYSPQAGNTNLTTVGALTSGSIGSGFGAINIGSNAVNAGSANLSGNLSAGTINVTGGSSGNWNTAYNWGDHSVAGYLTSQTSHADVVVDGDFSSAGIMATNGSGTYSIVTDNSSNWNTAFGWGNHASAGYLTSFTETSHADVVVDGDFGSNGILKRTSAGNYGIVTDNSSNWDSAFGWGNHASAGYLTSFTETSHADVVVDGDFSSAGLMATNGSGTYSIVTDSSSNWNTAFGWGNHASAGYLTSQTSHADVLVDGDFGSAGLMATDGSGTYSIVSDSSSNWNTAFGWGNHASAGYLTTSSASSTYAPLASPALTGTPTAPTPSASDNSTKIPTTAWVTSKITASGGMTALSDDSSPQLSGTLDANGQVIDMGSNNITDTKVGQWDTAYGWGNHASAGYLTSQTSHADVVVDGDFGSNGLMKRSGAGSYSIVTDNSSNWDSAYGWGDHASGGYLTTSSASSTYAPLAGATFSGNVSLGSNDLTTTGKVLFANMYANSSAYPSASTYHGCFIHDHALGVALYSHAGSWIQLANNSQLANSSNWDSAYGWGNHASAGYLTSQTSHSDVVVDGDFGSNGIMTRTGAGSYAMLTDNSSNWDSAFGWGNHASAGYLTGITGQSLYSLSNVYSSSSPSDGQVLTWDNANSYWKPTTVSGGGGGLSQSQVEAIAEENAIAMAIALG